MVRIKRESGKDSFELCPEKKNKLHDDRAYTMCMSAYALQQERRKNITKRRRETSSQSLLESLSGTIKSSKRRSLFGD